MKSAAWMRQVSAVQGDRTIEYTFFLSHTLLVEPKREEDEEKGACVCIVEAGVEEVDGKQRADKSECSGLMGRRKGDEGGSNGSGCELCLIT